MSNEALSKGALTAKPRILFVDDEPNILQGIRRLLFRFQKQWEIDFAESGKEALEKFAAQPFDFLVSDMRMPNMDGAELLQRIKTKYPDTIRLVLSGQSDRDQIMRSVKLAHRYFTKPCQEDELIETISGLVQWRQKIVSSEVKKIASSISFVPSNVGIINELVAELEKTAPNIGVVRNLVCQDIGLSIKLIQIVSSSFFGERKVIYDPGHAATLLGMDLLRKLLVEAEIYAEGDEFGQKIARLCNASIEMANAAREIAEVRYDDVELQQQAYLSGLLTNVGKMILMHYAPEKYQQVVERVKEKRISLVDAESEIFGLTHTEVGGYILGLWGLPEKVIEAVYYYKDPAKFDREKFHPVTAVFLADTLDGI